ncbi:MAG: bifunctional riboflavin kinase/FAD synthetase [Chitinophagaceae bacterium]|nr:MAG: bifunctional riboflavin kinase/FAD synthetase [Chitinophagaceae bacterium]
MKIHFNIDDLPVIKNAVITIGTFDGVHEGHKKIIQQIITEARKINGESVIISFHPHPRKVVSSSILGIRLINTIDERIELLKAQGIDHLVIIPFTDLFANQQPEDYLKNFLIKNFHPSVIIIGYDHKFGKDRKGDFQLLEKYQSIYNYELQEIPKHILHDTSISSTNIRNAILKSDFETANQLLGYHFFFEGEVIHGDKIGRTIGYPTANLQIKNEEKIIPGDGVYAVYVEQANQYPLKKNYKGMMSIGFRPTVNGKKRVVEVNIFDFTEEIYGQMLRVHVKTYLRPELKFDSLEALTQQIDQDKIDSLAVL